MLKIRTTMVVFWGFFDNNYCLRDQMVRKVGVTRTSPITLHKDGSQQYKYVEISILCKNSFSVGMVKTAA